MASGQSAPDSTSSTDTTRKEATAPGQGKMPAPTARDTAANNPRHGTLTKQEEITELPKAGQVNNHSSTALEKDSGR
jgi:hypothetical protein